MGWSVILSKQAERDLSEIIRYISCDDPIAGERFGMSLIARTELLGEQPRLGTVVRGWKQVRALLHSPYYIVYRCENTEQTIDVLRFWHSARDLGALKIREFDT